MSHNSMDMEVFFCERYRPLFGWSANYLLPTDKHAYRMRGAKAAWSSIKETEEQLLAPGWSWEKPVEEGTSSVEGWNINTSGQEVDDDLWSYSTGFPIDFAGSDRRGSLRSYARWRRLTRKQNFTGSAQTLTSAATECHDCDLDVPYCPHFDIDGAAEIGRKLMEAVAAASLHGEWSDHGLVLLKRAMWKKLTAPRQKQEEGTEEEDIVEGAVAFKTLLLEYVNSFKSITARLVENFVGEGVDPDLSTRIERVKQKFPAAEREAYAVLAIRRFHLEPECKASKEEPHEGPCPLRPVFCPYEGCTERCSANVLEEHDKICPRKPTNCEDCGEQVAVGDLSHHKQNICCERVVPCSYATIGCPTYIKHNKLESHLAECEDVHVKMMAKACAAQQEIIDKLAEQLQVLEELAIEQRTMIAEENQMRAQLQTRLEELEKKEATYEATTTAASKKALNDAWWDSRKKTNAVYYETQKQVTLIQRELEKTAGTEIVQMSKDVAQLNLKASLKRQKG